MLYPLTVSDYSDIINITSNAGVQLVGDGIDLVFEVFINIKDHVVGHANPHSFFLAKTRQMNSAVKFQIRIIVPPKQTLDISWLAVGANNLGYLLENQKVYTSEKDGSSIVYLYFSAKTSKSSNSVIIGS